MGGAAMAPPVSPSLPMLPKLLHPLPTLLILVAFALPSTAADRPPIEDFFGGSSFSGARLSPSGKYLAVRIADERGWQRLAVVDTATNAGTLLAQVNQAGVNEFDWVNDERIVFNADGDSARGPGLWAINRDGSGFRQLAGQSIRGSDNPYGFMQPWNTFLASVGAQDTEHVYVTRPNWRQYETRKVDLFRLNTRTGHADYIKPPPDAQAWYFDGRGQPRFVYAHDTERHALYTRDPARGDRAPWTKVFEADFGDSDAGFDLAGIAPDGTVYVTARSGNADKTSLYRFDVKLGVPVGEPIVDLRDFDFRGSLIVTDRVLGIRYTSDADGTVWYDPGLKAAQDKVDQLLPGSTNRISVPRRPQVPWVLVVSDADRQPPVYRLFNTETGALNTIGMRLPKIKPQEMAKTQFVRYKARDGLDIPAWLTLPRGADPKNLPVLVLVHGGPNVDGRKWEWDEETQFFASRGYAVLEPDFRGTTGYGFKHFQAGWKQWGLKMQDDLADGTRWLIGQGIADPKRICIYGASYGGYAALMGLVNDPDLYQCAIDLVGVTDIKLMYEGHWSQDSDITTLNKKYGMPQTIGDPVKDAAQFKATSPIEQAGRITQPLLLAYGGENVRVPAYHGRLFKEAVSKTNKEVEWLLYDDEGHGISYIKNRLDFYGRVEAFLDKHIGK